MARESKYPHERYAKVGRRVWDDEQFRKWSAPPPNAQTLWLYLLTNPGGGSIPGLFRFSLAETAERFGWPLDDVTRDDGSIMPGTRSVFREIVDSGRAEYDPPTRLIYLPNALGMNEPASPNVVVSWWRQWAELPESALRTRAQRAMSRYMGDLGPAFAIAFQTCFSGRRGKASPTDVPPITESEEQKSRRAEEQKSRSGEGAGPSPPSSPPPPTASPPLESQTVRKAPIALNAHALRIREELVVRGPDLFGLVDATELDAQAFAIAMSVERESRSGGDGVPYLGEAIAHARKWKQAHRLATSGQLLAEVGQKVEWILADIRARKRGAPNEPANGKGLDQQAAIALARAAR